MRRFFLDKLAGPRQCAPLGRKIRCELLGLTPASFQLYHDAELRARGYAQRTDA